MATLIPAANADTASAAAAKIILADVIRTTKKEDASAAFLVKAVLPLYGVVWNRAVIAIVTADPTLSINKLLQHLRSSNFPSNEYKRLAAFFKQAFSAAASFPAELYDWKVLAERFRLDSSFGWDALLDSCNFLAATGICSPKALAILTAADFYDLSIKSPFPAVARALWTVARTTVVPPSSSAEYLTPAHAVFTQDSLVKAIRTHAAQYASTGQLRVATKKKLHIPRNFSQLGPSQRIKLLQAAALVPSVLDRYVKDATQANLLKQVKGSLPGMSSAFRCYTAFCELRKTTAFPPHEETVIQWSSMFRNTATYGNYVSHLEKCCFFLRYPTTWYTAAVRHVVKGLKKCQDRSFRFHNFIRSPLLLKIVEKETPASEFAQAAFLSFLFSFRVPSETLQLQRDYYTDEIAAFTPQTEKALIGVRYDGNEPFLICKLSRRKNLTSGCILRRPCFCFLTAKRAASICPIHVFWQHIRCRVEPGDFLFKNINQRNFNRVLKAVLAKLGVPEAARYSSHGFRRGTSQELKESGSPWTVVASSGIWHSPCFRGYLDMSKDVGAGARQLFDVDFDSDSGDDEWC